jgi:hypothetical protein
MHKLVLMILLGCSLVWARFEHELEPRRIEVGKPFIYSLIFVPDQTSAQRSFPEIGNLKDFELVKKDSVDEQRASFFNRGLRVRKYRYHLVSHKTGVRALGPISIVIDGRKLDFGTVQVNVERSYDSPALDVILHSSRREVYVGEQFRIDVEMGTFPTLMGITDIRELAYGDEFWAQRSPAEYDFREDPTGVYSRRARSPLAYVTARVPGAKTIGPINVIYRKQGPPRTVVKESPGFRFESIKQEPELDSAMSNSVAIQVLPLPTQGQPANFNGMVGQYTMQVELSAKEIML